MIYKDSLSKYDTESCPADRSEPCKNCGENWFIHEGWACRPKGYSSYVGKLQKFSSLHWHERYLTASMAASIMGAGAAQTVKRGLSPVQPGDMLGYPKVNPPKPVGKEQCATRGDMSDWRNWAHSRPGECKCGIPRDRCDYHREELKR